jgi:hypothetical protein
MSDAEAKAEKTPEEKQAGKKRKELKEVKGRIRQLREAHRAGIAERKDLETRAAKLAAELGLPVKAKKA